MTDRAASSAATYIVCSAVAVVAGFVLLAKGFWSDYAALLSLGVPLLWTILLAIGLLRHGKRALWLLAVAPFALYQLCSCSS
jgi:hypothetical protein